MSVYSPGKELSLDEAMLPHRGSLKYRTYNPRKITKYGVLVRMVCKLNQVIFVTWKYMQLRRSWRTQYFKF
jgi:hypothetical protein